MIIIKISGGIGNQLFQYSFGRYLSIIFDTELKLDIQTNYDLKSFTNRKLGLNNFVCNLNYASETEVYKLKYFNIGYPARIERKLNQVFPFLNGNYIVEKSNDYLTNNKRIRDDCYYDGYWQSEKYFKKIENIIRNDLKLKSELSVLNSEILGEILKSNSISIHIRRGDYISVKANSNIFILCSMDYYNEAIKYFTDRYSDPVFYIFSDDLSYAKNYFKGPNFRFIENNKEKPEIDLFLMSKCQHNIIANSTFSWWSAWLNSNPNKKVFAPKEWYKGHLNDSISDLLPSDWVLL